jgi:hypothetical protein
MIIRSYLQWFYCHKFSCRHVQVIDSVSIYKLNSSILVRFCSKTFFILSGNVKLNHILGSFTQNVFVAIFKYLLGYLLVWFSYQFWLKLSHHYRILLKYYCPEERLEQSVWHNVAHVFINHLLWIDNINCCRL